MPSPPRRWDLSQGHFIEEKGDGPDLLWIPAGDQTGDVFFELFSYFTDTHRCLSYNPPGAG